MSVREVWGRWVYSLRRVCSVALVTLMNFNGLCLLQVQWWVRHLVSFHRGHGRHPSRLCCHMMPSTNCSHQAPCLEAAVLTPVYRAAPWRDSWDVCSLGDMYSALLQQRIVWVESHIVSYILVLGDIVIPFSVAATVFTCFMSEWRR